MKRKLLNYSCLTVVMICGSFRITTYLLKPPTLFHTVALLLIILIPSILILSKVLDRIIFNRLSSIKQGINNIIENPEISALDVTERDELSELVQAINHLQMVINSKQNELMQAHKDMEMRVFRRTDELAGTIEALKAESHERLKAENEVAEQRLQLIKDEKLKTLGILSAGVAHEINNPNNFISLNVPLLQNVFNDLLLFLDETNLETNCSFGMLTLEELKDAVPQLLDGISSGSERIANIVNSLKRYSQKRPSDISHLVEINTVITDAMPLIENLIKNSTSNFQLILAQNVNPVFGDGRQIEQIIVNLLQNSCFALESRDKAIIIRTYNSVDEQSVIIEVKDQGTGIPTEFITQIQDPFFTTRREEGGTGLGLSISTNIAHEHNGELLFESSSKLGTTARLILPAAHTETI